MSVFSNKIFSRYIIGLFSSADVYTLTFEIPHVIFSTICIIIFLLSSRNDKPCLLNARGMTKRKLGRMDDAIADLDVAISRSPNPGT